MEDKEEASLGRWRNVVGLCGGHTGDLYKPEKDERREWRWETTDKRNA